MPVRDAAPQRLTPRLAACVVVAVVLTAFGSTLWMGRLAQQKLVDSQIHSLEVLSRTLAASLSHKLDKGWSDSARTVAESVELDPRTAFISVSNVQQQPIYHREIESGTWNLYTAHRDRIQGGGLGQPLRVGGNSPIVAQTVPIWNPPLQFTAPRPTAESDQRQLVGYVTLGLHDRSTRRLMTDLRSAQLTVALVVCLVFLPVVVWLMMRWLAPLRQLADAVEQLGRGDRPDPVPARSRDELGVLARAFNAMVDRLVATQRELQEANQHLEAQVARRTAQLEAANQKLEAEIKDKDDFLRAVTHDLGAPVRNISGLANMLAAKHAAVLADDAVRKLDRITANARHQTELIQDLLELSRIRTRPGKREWFELGEVMSQLRDAFWYDLDTAGITLEIPDGLPRLYAERNRIRQAFQNLLDNAIKYMLDAETRRITIEHREDEHYHFFAVADTGKGIAEEDLAGIFQMFRRAAHSGTDRVPGKGVGLASVKTIVEAYAGTIRVSSKLGKGTRFDFTLAKTAVRADPEADPHANRQANRAAARETAA
ncbi:MAG: ATP-binding protein [Phycisphaeraceae bacterium]